MRHIILVTMVTLAPNYTQSRWTNQNILIYTSLTCPSTVQLTGAV